MIAHAAYAALAGVFFAFCAYAQLNDPDAATWATIYLAGGTLLGAVAVAASVAAARPSASPRAAHARTVLEYVVELAMAAEAAHGAYLGVGIYNKRADLQAAVGKELWAFFELEEGREVAGLVMLFAHAYLLLQILRAAKSTTKSGSEGATGNGSQRQLLATLIIVVSILVAASVAWILYQPLMNKRYNVEHCNGVFGS